MANQTLSIIETLVETPAPGVHAQSTPVNIPDALLSDHLRLLAGCASMGAVAWTFGLMTDAIVKPLTLAAVVPASSGAIEIVAIAVSARTFLYVRYSAHAQRLKSDVALLYPIVNGIDVALLNTWDRTLTVEAMGHLSWNTVV